MIEILSKKRMLLAITALGAIFVLVVIIESKYLHTPDEMNNSVDIHDFHPILKEKLSSECWKNESYSVIKECDVCTANEIKLNSPLVCVQYGYKEKVKCSSGKESYRSCTRVTWIEDRNFWRFEWTMIIFASIFSSGVYIRQKQLDHKSYQRLQKQMIDNA
ncbi:protein JTB [Lepeophtheirus salmonis]|uniref:protein JTB n=1 Tax=Lepeophtheirus salmonis TaxID=72036 RepID=UPI001AEBA3C0|nr:protein JTB-like [Lepeophtheirus salmonis]